MQWSYPWIMAGLVLVAPGAQAQLPGGGGPIGQVGQIIPDMAGRIGDLMDKGISSSLSPARLAERLMAARSERIGLLLRQHGNAIELDDRREPARRGVIILTGVDAAGLDALQAAGFGVESEIIAGLDLAVARLSVPDDKSLARALKDVRRIVPQAQASADNLYFSSGATPPSGTMPLASGGTVGSGAAGLIDGGVARHPALTGSIEQRGFARGAPMASAHGTAVASLISGTGTVRGAAPGAPLLVADVYGNDPAGGSAMAIARALGWMVARKVQVATVSLVGPDNPILAGAIRLASERGVTVVAAVGNDGPASRPAYPASYPGVIAVTGIDGRGRLLPEAGRALHVDFAAPGADMNAAQSDGGNGAVRGTSFAAPLVAGRLLVRGTIDALRAEAEAPKSKARGFGQGIVCAKCRNID